MRITETMEAYIQEIEGKLAPWPELARMFRGCYTSTYETTIQPLADGTHYVITGDIPAMWLRDSAAQVRHYLPLAAADAEVGRVIAGVIRRQLAYIRMDPYANAFNEEPNDNRYDEDLTELTPWIWERKYEVDSLCYPLQLSYLYWQATGSTELFDEGYWEAVRSVVQVWSTEQRHDEASPYRFIRENCPPSDTLRNGGRGMPTGYTGMTWSGFRPSDDACKFGYLIPANMFAVTVLAQVEAIFAAVQAGDAELLGRIKQLREEIEYGIETYGVIDHPVFGKIYAYETDGRGHYHLMDDANVPSLLSIPYLGYRSAGDPLYKNTRAFVLSAGNPYYFQGRYASGIGSPHTPEHYIWPISLAMQGLTTDSPEELEAVLDMLGRTHAGTYQMHEGFHKDNPNLYTRPWFAWANSLLAELLIRCANR